MTEPNPFASPAEISQSPATVSTPANKSLWLGYAIAPAVAPLVFAIVVFIVGMVWHMLNPDHTGTPIGVILVPIFSVTVGVVASYGVAGVIGMPIAFHLRKRKRLNGYTIHVAALLWSLAFTVFLTGTLYVMTQAPRPEPTTFIFSTLALFAMLTPCILLSATTFWLVVRRGQGRR
jgi:hypothetical protein